MAVHLPNRLQLGPMVSAQHVIGFVYVLEYFIWLTYFTLPSIPVSCMDICLLLWQMASRLYFIKHRSQLGVPSGWMTAPSRRDPGSHPHHTVMGDDLDIGQLYATLDKCQLQQYIMNIHEITYHYLSLQIFYSNGKFCCSILKLILSSPSNAFMVNPIIY